LAGGLFSVGYEVKWGVTGFLSPVSSGSNSR